VNTFIWCAVGLMAGWLATVVNPLPGVIGKLETLAVAVFGAFVGGEFLDPAAGAAAGSFRVSSLGLSVAGAVLMLVLLTLMRKVVGPMRPHKVPRRK
jgi:uncharacterized membrane protein YeaQ/YmgE (transglycosylase-associated protein family)